MEGPFTQVPNRFLDRLNDLSGSEVVLLAWVYRQTLGYHRPIAPMTLTDVVQRTGLSRQGVLDARQKAMEHGLLTYAVKGGIVFWEPIIQAAPEENSGQMNRPEAVKPVDHDPAAVKSVDRSGQISRPPESNDLTAGVKLFDRSLNKDLKKDSKKNLKKEREAPALVYPLDFNFEEMLLPCDYRRVPELALYMKVTKRTPGSRQLTEIVRAIRVNRLTEEQIKECWRHWAVINGYRPENLVWLVEWGPAYQKGAHPWERSGSGRAKGAPGRDAPAARNTVSPEELLADLEER